MFTNNGQPLFLDSKQTSVYFMRPLFSPIWPLFS